MQMHRQIAYFFQYETMDSNIERMMFWTYVDFKT